MDTRYPLTNDSDDDSDESVDDKHGPRSARKPDRVFSECGWGVNELLS
jgi:hypothetical protein